MKPSAPSPRDIKSPSSSDIPASSESDHHNIQDEDVRTVAAGQQVAVGAGYPGVEVVRSGPADQGVGSVAVVPDVVAGAAIDAVGPATTVQAVVAVAAQDRAVGSIH